MSFVRLILPILLVLAVVLYVAAYKSETIPVSQPNKPLAHHQASYPLKDFYPNIEQVGFEDKIPDQIYGGIVSHHLLTAPDIAEFFAELRSQDPSTIVLIGPNHFSAGNKAVSISAQSFETPWGIVESNHEVITELITRQSVFHDETPFVEEHSIASLVSYIAYNFPKSTIVPIVLKREVTRTQLDRLARDLSSILPPDAVVVASVDFSHHLNRVATKFHDAASVSAIRDFDFDRLFDLEIDSPPSIYTLLTYLDAREARRFTFKNKDSTDYTGNRASEDLTSYVFGHFVRGEAEDSSTKVTSLHFGDTMFARDVTAFIEAGEDPFEKVQGVEGNFLRGVDITVANLEGVIVDPANCEAGSEIVLTHHPTTPDLLKRYHFDGVSLANNHRFDCKEKGLLETVNVLNDKDLFALLPPVDEVLSVVTKVIGDHRVALVGLDALGIEGDDRASWYTQLKAIKEDHDSLIVHIHWGYEYDQEPSLAQRQIARRLVDAGVDAVIGHHPHVVQPVERYKNGIIFYSLGNFIFDQPGDETRMGFGVGLVHDTQTTISGYLFPYEIINLQPTLLPYERMSEYCDAVLGSLEKDIPCQF